MRVNHKDLQRRSRDSIEPTGEALGKRINGSSAESAFQLEDMPNVVTDSQFLLSALDPLLPLPSASPAGFLESRLRRLNR
jgi:hypothetical protein